MFAEYWNHSNQFEKLAKHICVNSFLKVKKIDLKF